MSSAQSRHHLLQMLRLSDGTGLVCALKGPLKILPLIFFFVDKLHATILKDENNFLLLTHQAVPLHLALAR